MKNNRFLILVIAIIFSLSTIMFSACKNSPKDSNSNSEIDIELDEKQNDDKSETDFELDKEQDDEKPEEINYVTFSASCPSFVGNKSSYQITHYYSDEYFKQSSFDFNIDLAKLSLGLTSATRIYGGYGNPDSDKYVKEFYNQISFDNIYVNDDYFKYASDDIIGVAFAHKKIDNFDVVAVSIRGYYGGDEWLNNFNLSNVGHHYGFNKNAINVYSELKNYINNSNFDKNNLKIWATGYSRSAAIAGLLGVNLNDSIDADNELNLSKENIFVYTFESPNCVDVNYQKGTKNIHNIINNLDFVVQMPPVKFGLKRAGIDYDISSLDILEVLNNYDDSLMLEPFKEKILVLKNSQYIIEDVEGGYTDLEILYENFLSHMLSKKSDKFVSISNREEYVNNMQDTLLGMLKIYFDMTEDQKSIVYNDLKGCLNGNFILSILINSSGTVYGVMKSAFDKAHITYDDEKLYNYSRDIQNLIYMIIYSSDGTSGDIASFIGNAKTIGMMHNPIVTTLLLDIYAEKNAN